jgi:protein O-mannosyl-transferase
MPVSHPRHPVRRHHSWLLPLALFVLTAALFSRAILNGFVNYDDDVYVYANSRITHGVTFSGVVRAFMKPHARNWHPLTTISHMLDCQLFGLNPAGPHAINVLLHALAAAGLFLFLHRATGSTWRAAVVAGLFAVHPLRVESVAWISERKDVLSALFFMATLLAYVRYARAPDRQRMLLVALLLAAGLMAKPMLVSLPLLLLLVDFWPLRRLTVAGGSLSFARAFSEKILLFALAALSCVLTVWAQRGPAGALDPVPFYERLANAPLSYCTYIYQLIWPNHLAVFYPLPAQPDQLLPAVTATIFLLGLSAAAFIFRRRFPYFFTGWFWYLLMLVPVVGIWPSGLQAHADRYTYLPHIGLVVALVWGSVELLRYFHALRLALLAAAAVMALLAWQTWQQIGVWRNGETLWRNALAVTSDNDVALNNLGLALQDRGDLDGALNNFRAALRVLDRRKESPHPLSRAFVVNNIGNNFARRNQLDEAIAEYRQCISFRPDFANAHVNLADMLMQQRDWTGALAEYEQALRLQPNDAGAQHSAGVAALRLGNIDQAIACYKKALASEPEFSAAALDLGNALAIQGRIDEAEQYYRRAVESDPRNVDAHFNLGRMYLSQQRGADAVREYERVVALAPNDADAHSNLARALAATGLETRAAAEYENALQLAPDSVSMLNNFAWLLASAADPSVRDAARAIDLAQKASRLAPEPHALIYHTLAAAFAAAGKTADAITAAERAEQLAEARGDTKLVQTVKKELESYKSAAAR